jgi:hypothetical protein
MSEHRTRFLIVSVAVRSRFPHAKAVATKYLQDFNRPEEETTHPCMWEHGFTHDYVVRARIRQPVHAKGRDDCPLRNIQPR